MNFYLSAIDDLLRHPDDQRNIDLVLSAKLKQISETGGAPDWRPVWG